jgi:hypothetical protein
MHEIQQPRELQGIHSLELDQPVRNRRLELFSWAIEERCVQDGGARHVASHDIADTPIESFFGVFNVLLNFAGTPIRSAGPSMLPLVSFPPFVPFDSVNHSDPLLEFAFPAAPPVSATG